MNSSTHRQDLQELKGYLLQGIKTVKPHAALCLEGTRTSILADVDVRTNDCDGANIIHIYGAPGSGKSSISLTAKSRLQRQRRLVTYFRFDRNEATTTTPTSLWRHVAYDLARLFPSILSQLLEQLRNDEVNLDSPIDIFTYLVEDPLSNIASPFDRPLVIIIDALDECGGLAGRLSSDRQILLQTLRRWAKLPKHFKLLVTTRQEGDITRVLSSISTPIEIPSGHFIIENPNLEAAINSSNDIRIFLEDRFQSIRQHVPSLPAEWPGSKTTGDMVHRAAGIFMWATTAANFIDSGIDPIDRLRSIMEDGSGSSTMKPLYSLYSVVLETGFGEIPSSGPEVEILQSVLGTMVLAKRPLIDVEYTKLPAAKSVTQVKLDSIREGLRSVIAPGSLRFVHKSFDDFLLSEECPPKYAIRKDESHYLLTKLCLTTMREGLRFNMCGLESSFFKNVDAPDIANKVANGISPLLSYSCLFFTDHLGLTPFDEYIMREVEEMMLVKLLFWFEAMSLLKEIRRISPSLLSILKWSHVSPNDEFKEFLYDARRFIGSFGVVVAQSAPHLYISALPFAPENSSVAKRFLPQFPWILALSTGKPANWPSCIFTSGHHTDQVFCIAFSADEEYFATGSRDQSVCVFDSETGNLISGPFECSAQVYSVFFDPNDRQVWAGCCDGNVTCWDIETGNGHLVFCDQISLWYLHPHFFNCRFSGSEKIISAGKSIAFWNGETGECEQHYDWMQVDDKHGETSMSPDGCYIAVVAGRYSSSIRIWKVVQGSKIEGPVNSHPQFEHPSRIYALSFSIDSKFIVSGSEDGSVLFWDASTGDRAGPPLSTGHGRVEAVAYSPNNHVLTSTFGLVTIWSAVTHELLGRLEGHTSTVYDIALLRDGQRVLTASGDRTMRMWDLGRKGVVLGTNTNQTHTSDVVAVAFSRCGGKLTSLDNRSIQIWDTKTGKSLLKCTTGVEYRKVIFSPDGNKVLAYGALRDGIGVWNANTRALVSQLDLDDEDEEYTWIHHAAFRSTDGVLVLCSRYGVVRIWSIEDGVPQTIAKLFKVVALSPDGLTAIVSDIQRSHVWSTTTHQPLPLTLADDVAVSNIPMAYSLSGKFFVSSTSGFNREGPTLRVWDMLTGGLAACFSTKHSVSFLAFSPDDRHVTCSGLDQIRIFDACTGQLTSGPWSAHAGDIWTLAFSPDGKLLASGGGDRQVRVWNVPNMLGNSQLSLSNSGVGTHMEDGWVKDEGGNLLFWVPNDHRTRLVWPHSVPLGESKTTTELDLSRFRYGESWAECYSGGDSSRRRID